jgi:transposase-like protein
MSGATTFDLTNPIFHNDDAARAHLEAQRWPDGPECPHCGEHNAQNITRLDGLSHRAGLCQCNSCRKQFSVTVGTIFEDSKIGLAKWVLATHLMSASKKGISAKQIERMLGVTYKTAWFMCHRIRLAMTPSDGTSEAGPIGGKGKTIEADETYVGGKAKNVHNGKPVPLKRPVVALVERGGEVRAKHVPNVTAKNVRKVLVTNASRKSDLHTDDSLLYYWLGREFEKHMAVNHSADEYVRGDVTTNSVESFFAVIKRQMMGTHHAVSEAHLQRYINEIAFRWNNRAKLGIDDWQRANNVLKGAEGKRLTYRRPDEAANA